VLSKPLNAGQELTITTRYGGKEAVSDEGGGNYFPVARTNWYPNTTFGDYAQYHMLLRIPKRLRMVASGTPLRDFDEGSQNISEWKTDVPQAVAGFNFGKFRREQVRLEKEGYLVESYANEVEPDIIKNIKQISTLSDLIRGPGGITGVEALGNMSTVGLAKKA